MAFRKTGIALSTRVLDRKDAGQYDGPPANPRIGDMWDGMVWDGEAWVPSETFEQNRSRR